MLLCFKDFHFYLFHLQPTSNYFLFQGTVDFSSKYIAFSYLWLLVKFIDSFKDGFKKKMDIFIVL